jgi:4-amino-4-deoxy-L-arabinose transferase-like glycosyltransferase
MVIAELAKQGQLTAQENSMVSSQHIHSGATENTRRKDLITLGLLLVASLAIRVGACALWGRGAIEAEGAGLARIAENLRKGAGYVGIMSSGLELNTPPLFPFLISGVSFVTGDYVRAVRLVSLVMGALLPLPVFGIALRLFGRRTALVAAALTILYPLLINMSVALLVEGPYPTLLLSSVYLVLCALKRPSTGTWCGVGGAFGLAYLMRPEAVVPFLIAVLFALTVTKDRLAIKCKRAGVAVAMFAVLALPEVIFIYKSTGKVLLDGKSAIVFALDSRILAAQGDPRADYKLAAAPLDEPSSAPNVESWQPWEEKWASNAINAKAEGTGIWMRTNAEVIRDTHITLKGIAHIVGKSMRWNIPAFLQQLSSKWLGAPFLPALALLGALRRPWRPPLASSRLFVVLVLMTPVLATFATLWIYPRFYFVLVPFLLIWAANGLVEVGRWTKASVAAAGGRWLGPGVLAHAVPTLIGFVLVVYPLRAVRDLYEFKQGAPSAGSVELEQVGSWIGQQQDRPVKIMGTIPVAFYANGEFVPFPYCSAELAIRFLNAAKVDYVVLRRGERYTRYYEDWLAKGIGDPRAEPVHMSSGANAGEFRVLRWHRADRPESPKPSPCRNRPGGSK